MYITLGNSYTTKEKTQSGSGDFSSFQKVPFIGTGVDNSIQWSEDSAMFKECDCRSQGCCFCFLLYPMSLSYQANSCRDSGYRTSCSSHAGNTIGSWSFTSSFWEAKVKWRSSFSSLRWVGWDLCCRLLLFHSFYAKPVSHVTFSVQLCFIFSDCIHLSFLWLPVVCK